MYIKKYWGNFIGGSDDSLNLVAFLEDQKKEEIPLSEIFAKIGLDKQNWDFRQTVEYLEFTHSDGVEMDFPVSYTHLDGAIEITPIPTVEELNAHVWGEEFHACVIEQAEFEAAWESHT